MAADAVFSIAAPFTRPLHAACQECVYGTHQMQEVQSEQVVASVALPVQGHKDKAADSPGLY